MKDDNNFLEQTEDVDIKEIARLEELATKTEEKLLQIKSQIKKLKSSKKHKLRLFIRRLDVVSGLYWGKLIFWIGMAFVIIFLSSDTKTKAISAMTYIMGITFDMLILRKNQTKTRTDIIRLIAGILILIYIAFSIALGIGIASAALGATWIENLALLINWGLPICGITSTGLELANNIFDDD